MKKRISLRKRNLFKCSTYLIAILVSLALISSSSISITINKLSKTENIDIKIKEEEIPAEKNLLTGLAPNVAFENHNLPEVSLPFDEYMLGYIVNSSTYHQGPCYFETDDPSDINYFYYPELDDFLTGGTWVWDCYEKWIACSYSDGALWEIDPENGNLIFIGGGGVSLNGLAYDANIDRLYGASSDNLYEIDIYTGKQELIGSFGINDSMIGISCDIEGAIYGWDVKFSGDSYLYKIDNETGEATQLFSLGKTLTYAQDGDFCRDCGWLFLTAYISSPESGSYLCCVNIRDESFYIIGKFQGNSQITSSVLPYVCLCVCYDIEVTEINYPCSGYAQKEIPMQVTAGNYGPYTEYTDVQMQVKKYEDGPIILKEDFSGAFPPEGWETDWWTQSDTNYAGGKAPEARCNKDTQSSQNDNYDNYIMTPILNCSDIETVRLRFNFTADIQYPYCNLYVKYRKNSSCPYIDVTPWVNPIRSDFECEEFLVEISSDSFLGEEFQVKWEYLGYYNYFNNWYLDDVLITAFNYSDEYNETIENIEIPTYPETIIDFPNWKQDEWQDPDFEDTWHEYKVNAYTFLQDDNPYNNCKEKKVDLYFPFFHDVGTFNIEGPVSGPAQTLPVTGTIKNVGQYDEYSFKTYAEIAEVNFENSEQLFIEDFNSCDPWPPNGWISTYSNWECSNSNYAGGSSSEIRFNYEPIKYPDTYRLISPKIDSTDISAVEIEFNHYLNHLNGRYEVRVETSLDKKTWNIIWDNDGPAGPETVKITHEIVNGEHFYIAFTVKTQYYSKLYWYIDDLVVDAFKLKEPEYQDEKYISNIKVGQERNLEFDDWTPEFLQYETTGTKSYIARVWADLDDPEDKNHNNDEFEKYLELDFFHDVGIESVTSPAEKRYQRQFYAVDNTTDYFIWFNPEDPGTYYNIAPTGVSGILQGGTTAVYDWYVCDNKGNIWIVDLYTGEKTFIGNSGTGELTGLSYCDVNGVMYGCSTNKFYEISQGSGEASLIGYLGCDGPMISIDCDIEGNMYGYDLNFGDSFLYSIDKDTGYATKIGNTGVSLMYAQDLGYNWLEETMYACVFNYETSCGEFHKVDLETGKFSKIGNLKGCHQTTCLAIYNTCPPETVYMPPSIQSIEAVAENIGTFPEDDMTCNVEIYEYITNCTIGTLVYEDSISDIEINEPLGGKEILTFNDYNFSVEGPYGLFLNLVDNNDDYPSNNIFSIEIGCDDTPPDSTHKLDPPEPDGLNGWYVSDLEVTLDALDPKIGCGKFGSGVDEIKYTVNGVPGTFPGYGGSFTLTQANDAEDIEIVYWAVDEVGNEEPKHTFTIKMDQTSPVIKCVYTWEGSSPPWLFHFIANATDATSGMERVEFYLNEGLQETIYGPGPEYIFSLYYVPPPYAIWTGVAYDMAGNDAEDWFEAKSNFNVRKSSMFNNEINKGSNLKQLFPIYRIYSLQDYKKY